MLKISMVMTNSRDDSKAETTIEIRIDTDDGISNDNG